MTAVGSKVRKIGQPRRRWGGSLRSSVSARPRKPRRQDTAFEHVYRVLKKEILSFRLKPLDPLREVDLAVNLNVSRTPIREAIRRLERDGLVWFTPRKGVFVSPISLEDVFEIYLLREALEGTAASHAAARMTPTEAEDLIQQIRLVNLDSRDPDLEKMEELDSKVHSAVLKSAGLPRLQSIVAHLNEQAARMRHIGIAVRPTGNQDELLRVLEAIKGRDRASAESAMRAHIRASRDSFATF